MMKRNAQLKKNTHFCLHIHSYVVLHRFIVVSHTNTHTSIMLIIYAVFVQIIKILCASIPWIRIKICHQMSLQFPSFITAMRKNCEGMIWFSSDCMCVFARVRLPLFILFYFSHEERIIRFICAFNLNCKLFTPAAVPRYKTRSMNIWIIK